MSSLDYFNELRQRYVILGEEKNKKEELFFF